MSRKSARRHAHGAPRRKHDHKLFHFFIVVLIIFVGLLVLKYIWIKKTWYGHAVRLQEGIEKNVTQSTVDQAKSLATTITTIPNGYSLIHQPAQLQKYVESLSKETGRDIVVMDKSKKILADTISGNVGSIFAEDSNGEVEKTMFDGVERTFLEKSKDYMSGINQVVVQIKDATGTIIGAVVMSTSNTGR